MNANDSAFPCPVGHVECTHPKGMTIREYAAVMALNGILSDSDVKLNNNAQYQVVAEQSVKVADFVISELKRTENQ